MKRDFDREAKTWDQDEGRRRMALAIADEMAAALGLAGTETLLDYGAGTGLVTLRLSPLVRYVVCADSSAGMLEVLAAKARTAGVSNVRTLVLDLESQPAAAADLHADVLVSSMTLHHVADTATLARRFFAALTPGGKLALADLDTEGGDFHRDNTGVAHFGFDRKQLEAVVRAAGFESVSTRTAYTTNKTTSSGEQKTFSIFLLTARRP